MVVGFPSSGTYSSNVLDLVSFLIEVCLMEVSICRASNLKKSDENYWVVGLNANKLFCVVCKSPDLFPQVCMTSYIVLLLFDDIPTSSLCFLPSHPGNSKASPHFIRPFVSSCCF